MKNTMIATVGSLLLGSALLMTAAAQSRQVVKPGPLTPKPITTVKCSPYGNSDVATQVVIENNTAQVIAKGTKISWSTNAGIKGSQVLQNNLAVGAKVTSLATTPSNSTACSATF